MAEYVEGLDMLGEDLEDENTGAGAADDQMVDVDFSNVGVVPPKGRYLADVTSSKKTTSAAGNTMVVLGMTIVAPESYAGVYVRDNLMLGKLVGVHTKEAFEAFGVPSRTPAGAFVGRRAILELAPEQNETYGLQARVRHYHAVK